MYYLLTFECCDFLTSLPETTLWESFDEALIAANKELLRNDIIIEDKEMTCDTKKGMFFIEDFCEIFPISVSSNEKITWLGEEFSSREKYFPYQGFSTIAGCVLQSFNDKGD